MNTRRNFIRAAALSTVTALQGRVPLQTTQLPAHTVPAGAVNEIDIGDPANTDIQCQLPEEAYVHLFEWNPPDPGLLSGACVHIFDRGQETFVSVSIGAQFLGLVDYAGIKRFFEAVEERIDSAGTGLELLENFPGPYPYCSNGGWLILTPDQHELRLMFGWHCFGFLRGQLADKFIRCLRQRLAEAEAA